MYGGPAIVCSYSRYTRKKYLTPEKMPERETEKVGIKATMVNHFFLNIFQFLLEGHFSPHQVCVMDFVDVVVLIQQWF